MKTNFLTLTVISALLAFTGCKKTPSVDQAQAPSSQDDAAAAPRSGISGAPPFEGGRKTSFQEVTAQLDPGGSLFLYLATDQWLAGLSTNISAFRQIIMSLPGAGAPNRAEMERVFDLLTRLVQSSGVEDVTGVGMSGAPVAPGLYRNKFILHHVSGAGNGFLWSMFGKAPHPLRGAEMLPANTALAAFGDLDVGQLWRVVQKEMTESGIPEAEEMARSFPKMFEKQTQIPWASLLASLGGEIGFALTLDEARKIPIPAGPGGTMEIPLPGLLIAIKANNDLLYDRVSTEFKKNPQTVVVEEDGLKMCSMQLPLPLPLPFELVVASTGDYFFFATTRELVRAVQAVRQGKQPALKTTPEFQDLAKHLPSQGNQMAFVSQKLANALSEMQKQAMRGGGMPDQQSALLQRLMGAQNNHSLSIGAHTATGWKTVSVGSKDPSSAIALAPVAGAAIGAGLLLPALAKAKGRAQTINSVNQMKQLGLAARMYSNDHKDKFPNAQTWCDDIKEYLGEAKVYKAPNDSGSGQCSYAFNEKLSGVDEAKISPQTVLFFEADSGWNRSGGPEIMLRQPRTPGTYVVGLADGSVQQMSVSRIKSLRWDP